jgi:threonine dehydratase
VKLDATRGYGAEVVQYDPATEDREAIGRGLANEHGLALIPPYDHPHVIAGQGTAARELLEDTGPLDVLFVCCGGGGLLSGSALSVRALSPHCRVIGVEPDAGDDGVRSFTTRTLQRVHHPQTIADGARTPSLGRYTFPMILRDVDHMMSVSDEALLGAMRLLWERMKVLVEPTGALGAAALLSGREAVAGKRVGVILSGGNVDMGRWFQRAS